MDDISSRARPPARRMASARPTASSVRRSSAGSGASDITPVSPARWAGVALVVAALLGAILLAVLSPGQRSTTPESGLAVGGAASPSPTAAPSGSDTRVPLRAPTIADPPESTITREWYVDVTVDVPREAELRRRQLELVVLVDGLPASTLPRPQLGGSAKVPEVPLHAGVNVLTAALKGPGGLGPVSAPITVHQDRDAPELRITAPEDGSTVMDSEVVVFLTSEPGASIVVRTKSKSRAWESRHDIGPSGTLELPVKLTMGSNRIIVSSTDPGGMKQEDQVVVQRKDGRPVIELSVPAVKRRDLPKTIRVAAEVRDADGKAIEGAEVSFTMSSPELSVKTSSATTNTSGRAVWEVPIPAGAGDAPPTVSVEVIAPNDERGTSSKTIEFS